MRKADQLRLVELRGARWGEDEAAWVLDLAAREGVALARFAADQGLSGQRLYWWRSRLEGERRDHGSEVRFHPVRVVPDEPDLGGARFNSGIRIETAGGHCLHVGRDFDSATLLQVLEVLGGAC